MIFRATKGNNWTITKSLDVVNELENDFASTHKENGEKVEIDDQIVRKSVFMIVYSTGNHGIITAKL
jgi:hypothetical protein